MRLLLLLLHPAFGFLTEIDHHHPEEVLVVGCCVKARKEGRRELESQRQRRDVVVRGSDLVRLIGDT
jgi:hypothetical protein